MTRTLERIKKDLTPEIVRDTVKKMRKYKFHLAGFFIIGFPFETREDVLETIDFGCSLPLDAAAFTLFTPLPGSEDFDTLCKMGKINLETYDWSQRAWVEGNPPEIYEHLNDAELKKLQKYATTKFYLRPRTLWHLVSQMIFRGQFKTLLMAGKRMINYLLGSGKTHK